MSEDICHLTSTLIHIVSLPRTPSLDEAEQNNMLTKSRQNCWLTPLPTCLIPPIYAAQLILHPFFLLLFDDRQWHSRAEHHSSLQSSGCSIWCTFDVVQAHCGPRLCLLAHDTQLRQGWNLVGRKEGNTLPSQTTRREKQQSVITQSVLTHGDIVQGFCQAVFDREEQRQYEEKVEIIMMPQPSPKIEMIHSLLSWSSSVLLLEMSTTWCHVLQILTLANSHVEPYMVRYLPTLRNHCTHVQPVGNWGLSSEQVGDPSASTFNTTLFRPSFCCFIHLRFLPVITVCLF